MSQRKGGSGGREAQRELLEQSEALSWATMAMDYQSNQQED